MPIHRGVAGGVLAEASLANQKLTIQELKAISFLREPEYMTPLSDLMQQSPHHAAESNETVSIDGCRQDSTVKSAQKAWNVPSSYRTL